MRLAIAMAGGIGLATLIGDPNYAQEQKNRERPRLDAAFFQRLDMNHDGLISLDEIPEERRERVKQLIERLDADQDGKLTRHEFDAGVARVRPREQPKTDERPDKDSPQTQRPPGQPRRSGEQPSQSPLPATPGGPPFGIVGLDLFRALDADNDGKLSRNELARAVDALMKHDRNGDGLLSPDEIAEGIRPPGRVAARPLPPGAFGEGSGRFVEGMIRRLDKNDDGKLSRDEVPERLGGQFERMDADQDGFLDKEELDKSGEEIRAWRREQRRESPRFRGRPGASVPGIPFDPPAGPINEANRQRVRDVLRQHDKDADGRISSEEFGDERADRFKRIDFNSDGFLTPDEIARGLTTRGDQPTSDPRRPEPQ